MSNNKQSSVELLIEQLEEKGELRDCTSLGLIQLNIDKNDYLALKEQAKEMHKEEIEEKLNVAYGNGYEQGEMDFYKKMQVKGDKYVEGYSEGYKRALELVKWKIDNELQGGNNEQQ